MISSPTSGIRSLRSNEYYFTPYDGKQYNLPPPSGIARGPALANRKTYRVRSGAGTKYDVRASYPETHVLRTMPTAPRFVPLPDSSEDRFMKTTSKTTSKDDKRVAGQAEVSRTRKDSQADGLRENRRFSLSASNRKNLWKVSKPAVKQRRRSSVKKRASKGDGEEACSHVCDGCQPTKAKTKVKSSVPGQRLLKLLSWYGLLIACCISICLVPTAAASSLPEVLDAQPSPWLDGLSDALNLLERLVGPFVTWLGGYAQKSMDFTLVAYMVRALPSVQILALFILPVLAIRQARQLHEDYIHVAFVGFLFYLCAYVPIAVLPLSIYTARLRGNQLRSVVGDFMNATAAIVMSAIQSVVCLPVLIVLLSSFAFIAVVLVTGCLWLLLEVWNAVQVCFVTLWIWLNLLLIKVTDALHCIRLVFGRMLASWRFWVFVVSAIAVANFAWEQAEGLMWNQNILDTRYTGGGNGLLHVRTF